MRIAAISLHLYRMYQVREFDRILNEEHWHIVADKIPITLRRIKFNGEAAHVARRIDRTSATSDGRESREQFRLLADLGQDGCSRIFCERFIELEIAMCARTTRMNNPLRNPLVIEMMDLFTKDEVLEERCTASARPQRILVVAYRYAMIGRDPRVGRNCSLMQFTAGPHCHLHCLRFAEFRGRHGLWLSLEMGSLAFGRAEKSSGRGRSRRRLRSISMHFTARFRIPITC